ncbi:uncharacterized protein LOC125187538 [Salvia hispanica]|uniref:uncharacterized protein LOC125187538 n=1 Tax=Salvia hispanica TaxID=49212 RepID=UPI0020097630|nr:uncharacterized protein LOC125187538 [Salvia hispanica]
MELQEQADNVQVVASAHSPPSWHATLCSTRTGDCFASICNASTRCSSSITCYTVSFSLSIHIALPSKLTAEGQHVPTPNQYQETVQNVVKTRSNLDYEASGNGQILHVNNLDSNIS